MGFEQAIWRAYKFTILIMLTHMPIVPRLEIEHYNRPIEAFLKHVHYPCRRIPRMIQALLNQAMIDYHYMTDKSPSQQIDNIIQKNGDWRGKTLVQLRTVITRAAPALIEEEVKWKKPSKPEGVPVWSHHGIICIGEMLKSAVRLTFPKGAALKDPKKLFNTRLDSKTIRAIDFHEDDAVDEAALRALILEAIELNSSKAK